MRDPSNGDAMAEVTMANAADGDHAVAAARRLPGVVHLYSLRALRRALEVRDPARSAIGGNSAAGVHLELGGKAPFVVFDDADLEAAIHSFPQPIAANRQRLGQ
nr:aldehyde dehydrogenase family protein [Cryobacterium aureum]